MCFSLNFEPPKHPLIKRRLGSSAESDLLFLKTFLCRSSGDVWLKNHSIARVTILFAMRIVSGLNSVPLFFSFERWRVYREQLFLLVLLWGVSTGKVNWRKK